MCDRAVESLDKQRRTQAPLLSALHLGGGGDAKREVDADFFSVLRVLITADAVAWSGDSWSGRGQDFPWIVLNGWFPPDKNPLPLWCIGVECHGARVHLM